MSIWHKLGFGKKELSDNVNIKESVLPQKSFRVYFQVELKDVDSVGSLRGSAIITSDTNSNAEALLLKSLNSRLQVLIMKNMTQVIKME